MDERGSESLIRKEKDSNAVPFESNLSLGLCVGQVRWLGI